MNNSFVFYRSYITGTEDLTDAEFRTFVKAMAAYALDGEEPELSGVLKMLFEFARPNIDFSMKKKRDGAKGGRPKTSGLTSGLSDKDKDKDKDKDSDGDVERECEGETPTPPATPRRRRTTKGGFSTSQGYNYDQILEENRRRLEERAGGVIDIKTAKEENG